jgi:fido (protein-threonine AMPylation protein)
MGKWETIPGETPIDDISGLIPKDVKTRGQLNVVEAINIHKVTVKYLSAKPSRRQAPFTLDWIYKLHKEMLGEVWTWAGQRRTLELNFGIPFHQIDVQLEDLLRDLQTWANSSMPSIEQAARLHHRAVQIHPFLHGWCPIFGFVRMICASRSGRRKRSAAAA